MPDFREYIGVDFTSQFLQHYGKGHLDGGRSGRYPWGSTNNVKGGTSTDKKKHKADAEDEKRTVEGLRKTYRSIKSVLDEANTNIEAGQRLFNETFQKWLNSQDNSEEERALDARMSKIMFLIQEDTKTKQEAENKLLDAALDADVMGYKVVPGIMGPKLVRKGEGDEDLVKYTISTDPNEMIYDPRDPESVAAYRQKIIDRYKNKK